MTLEALRKEIHQQAEAEQKKRLEIAREEANQLIEKAQRDADALMEQVKKEAVDEARGLQSLVSAARLEAKKKVAEAQDALVEKELTEARKLLLAFCSDRKYPPLLRKWVEKAVSHIGKGAVVYVRKKDLPLLKKWGFEAQPLECAGGCLVTTADGRIRVNNTLEVLFEFNKDFLRQKIFEAL